MPPAFAPIGAMALFVAVFALATLRGVHLGILMFVAACAAGVTLAGMTLAQVLAGFPVGILVLVAGVTFFFGIAQLNGTTDRLVGAMLPRTGRRATVPLLFFGLAAVAAAMGSPQAGLATGPLGMASARRAGIGPLPMVIALNSGISTGAFAPTSLFGVITHQVAREAGIDVDPLLLLAVAAAAHAAMLLAALALFRAPGTAADADRATDGDRDAIPAATPDARAAGANPTAGLTGHQIATILCMAGLLAGIVAGTAAGLTPDVGVVLLGMGALLALLDPAVGMRAVARIDWSTAFVVGGIVTYVGVLQALDAVNLLGRQAMALGSPLAAALLICVIAALVSAFASTTAVLAALVPMAVPLASTNAVPGWALITTLGVSATVVDVSPFSNTGATLIASVPEATRARLRPQLLRWSLAMTVVAPLVLLPILTLVFGG